MTNTPAPSALAAETLTLERTRKDLVNQACALTPAEIELLWKTAPPRMPMPVPNSETAKAMARDEGVERETGRGRPYSAALYQFDLNARRA